MPSVYLGIGSNIEPQKNLQNAVDELRRRFGKLELSAVYRSSAYGFDGEDFLNMVVGLESGLCPLELHAELERIQVAAGRDRDARGYSSRTLDIDLLLYDDLVIDEPPIRLPRPDVLRFGFVLGPLAEIAPELLHPESNQTLQEHWAQFETDSHPIVRQSVIL